MAASPTCFGICRHSPVAGKCAEVVNAGLIIQLRVRGPSGGAWRVT